MALTPPDRRDPLQAAADRLRRHTPAGWVAISATVHTVLAGATRHTWPVAVDVSDLPAGAGTIHLSDQVLISALRRRIDQLPGLQPLHIHLSLQADRCTGLTIEVAAPYGYHLPTLARQAHQAAHATLADLLGPTAAPPIARTHLRIGDLADHPRTGPAATMATHQAPLSADPPRGVADQRARLIDPHAPGPGDHRG